MCPRNHNNCSIVPVGIVPLLPSSNPPSPASSGASTPSHVDHPSPPSHDQACINHHAHPTPPPSSDEDHSDSPCLVFRSSLDKNDATDPASPSTPTRRSMSPVRTRNKGAQHTAPSQPLARDVFATSDRLAALCAPAGTTGSSVLTLPAFQMGPSTTHRSASSVGESDSDSDHCHHRQYTPSKRDVRKPLKRDEQNSDEDADVDATDDEVAVVPPPFAPPPCPYIQPGEALLSQPVSCFSLAQPAPSTLGRLAPPRMPLFPFMPLLPTPREHSSPSTKPRGGD